MVAFFPLFWFNGSQRKLTILLQEEKKSKQTSKKERVGRKGEGKKMSPQLNLDV